MKKRFFAAGLAIALSMAAVPVTISASAEIKEEECDRLFAATVNSLIDESDIENGKINALRKPLYDISVEPLGYVYEFSLKDSEGYAIIVNTDGNYIAQEVMPNAISPYSESEGQCVYVGTMTYLEYSEGVYTYAESGTVVPEEVVEYLAEDALYGDGGTISGSTLVTIYYESKSEDYYKMALMTPCCSSSPYVSACACVAGTNIVAYFDRYCPLLMPDYEPGYEYMGYYFYYADTNAMTDVVIQLYSDMGTTAESGTTAQQFLNGMKKYSNRAGYSFSYTSCMSGGNLSYSKVKNSMKNNQPVALFLSGYNVGFLELYEDRDSMGYLLSTANHVMVGFGYDEITYTYDSGKQETLEYICVASGAGTRPSGYFNINYNTKINDAFAVSMY
ncbi:MAG: hypothetical protein J1G07_02910 [Clostridiales bacterium]|nr:hypothetical protein [Clostridiales bacterium]